MLSGIRSKNNYSQTPLRAYFLWWDHLRIKKPPRRTSVHPWMQALTISIQEIWPVLPEQTKQRPQLLPTHHWQRGWSILGQNPCPHLHRSEKQLSGRNSSVQGVSSRADSENQPEESRRWFEDYTCPACYHWFEPDELILQNETI